MILNLMTLPLGMEYLWIKGLNKKIPRHGNVKIALHLYWRGTYPLAMK